MHLVKLLSKIGDSFPHQAEEVFRLLYRLVMLCGNEPRAMKFLITGSVLETLVAYFVAGHEHVVLHPRTGVPVALVPIPKSKTLLQTISGE